MQPLNCKVMEPRESPIQFRYALVDDIPALTDLIERSVRQLQAPDYSVEQMNGSLGSVFAVDTQLIADSTYFVAETSLPDGTIAIVGCGGWSKRKTLFGGDHAPLRDAELLDPGLDAAKIRAIFVHPSWARRGIGGKILAVCETAAASAGFTRFEMASTLTGVTLYQHRGYRESDRRDVPLANGFTLPVVLMKKNIQR